MNLNKINSDITRGNLELQRVLREIVQATGPSYIPGNIYVLFNSSDSAYVQYAKDWDQVYPDGTQLVQTSLANLNSAMSSNRHDVALINGQNGHTPLSMVSVTNNRVHFYGMGMREGGLGFGARARITMGDSATSADIALWQNTGIGNTYDNLKFDSSSTVAASIWGVAEGGEYTIYRNCEFYKSSDLDQTLAAELLHNGDSTQYLNCTFGSNANAISGAIIRPCVELARGTISGKVSRDTLFKGCFFWRWAGNAANSFVDATGVTDVERMLMFKDCEFVAAEKGSQPAEAVTSSGGKQTDGLIMLKGCSAWNTALLGEASVGIWVDGPDPGTAANVGVALEIT